jgi:hypothetical protein
MEKWMAEDRILLFGRRITFGKWVTQGHADHVQKFILIAGRMLKEKRSMAKN